MDGTALDDRRLRRTIALLVSLAVLAERAAGRCFLIRWLVLAVLRRGETAARAYVAELTQLDWPGFDEAPETGCGPADAALLGLRLRLLAALLGALLGPGERADGWPAAGGGVPCRPAPQWRVVTSAGRRAGPYDTS